MTEKPDAGATGAGAMTIDLPSFDRAAEVGSFDPKTNTVDVIWTTGAKVRRYSWRDGQSYDEELETDRSSVRLDRLNNGAPFLNTHDSWSLENVIGSVIAGSARMDGGKGYARIQLSRRPDVAGIVQDIRDGVLRNISVGYRIHKIEKTEADDGSVAVWRVVDWEPIEISAVPIPADPGAQFRSADEATGRRSLNPCVVVTRDVSSAITATSNGEQSMSDKQNSAADEARSDTTNTNQPPATDDAAIKRAAEEAARAAVEAERKRGDDIASLATRAGLRDLGDQHIRAGTSVDAFRTALLDAMVERDQARDAEGTRGGHAGGGHSISMGETDVEKRADAIASALLNRADASNELTAAGREFRGMTLLELAKDCLAFRGVSFRGKSPQEVADLALSQRSYDTRSGGGSMSTGDFPGILANVLNKTLRQGYQYAAQTFRPFTRVVTVNDFKPVQRSLLGEAPQFELVNEHGEFKRGAMGESKETYQIATFGKMVSITRQVIINDDLEAFTRVPRAFGIQASNLESDLAWNAVLSNPVMVNDSVNLFDAAHGNLAGTAAAIAVDSISAGRTAMSKQTGLDGKTVLNIDPKYLIVPKALQTKAEQFVGQIWATQTSAVVPESLKNLQVIAEPRLDNGVAARPGISGFNGSALSWYLAADPMQVDILELAYLAGAQGVYTETKMGFEVDGVQVKVRLDVGAKAIDHRGLYKNAGA